MEIAGTDQGGLGLPDRDYYLKTDAKSVELRKAYEQHVTNMFKLLGESPQQGGRRRQDRHEDRDRAGARPRWTASSAAIPTRSITR